MNPVADQLQVQLVQGATSTASLEVYNALGQSVQSHTVKAQAMTLTLNVSELPQGAYSVTLMNEEGIVDTQSFIKQ